jgi:hypothetical protein
MTTGIREVLDRMTAQLTPLEDSGNPLRYFLATYARTTEAVGAAVEDARFEDPVWVVDWDVAFAALYLEALDAHRADPHRPSRPWRVAFGADPALPPLAHVLLGMNAHINYDLPQALLKVIPDDDFARPTVVARRERDHERIDTVLVARVGAEDAELRAVSGPLRLLDRILGPANRAATKRFLREARRKVWLNTMELQRARTTGPDVYARRLAELELLSAARVADLLTPGPVLLRLAGGGFGVVLPPAD